MALLPPDSTHQFTVSNTVFEVPKRYSLIRSVGNGSYGVVMRILREITLLRQMDHENIVNIINILPPTDGEWTDLYIVSELMETDLHRIIYSKQALSTDHCQYFVYQILRALKYMHSANVMHRDLKPSNLLLNSNCDLKVCDLGLARGVEPEQRPGDLTEYVVTRWYRAPEIMLACTEYAKAIDVWSTGCIFAELLERQAVFPGDDYIDQIRKIIAKLGKPGAADLDFVTSWPTRGFHMVPAPPMAMLPGGAPMGAGQLTAAQQQQLMAAQLQAQQQAAAAAQAQAAAAGGGAPAAAPGAAAPQLLVTTVNGQQVAIAPTPGAVASRASRRPRSPP
ncbi:MAP kinase [Aureococcus anophagefferens]|nr:MAP kinase [Aureococcus anophagefferens]